MGCHKWMSLSKNQRRSITVSKSKNAKIGDLFYGLPRCLFLCKFFFSILTTRGNFYICKLEKAPSYLSKPDFIQFDKITTFVLGFIRKYPLCRDDFVDPKNQLFRGDKGEATCRE